MGNLLHLQSETQASPEPGKAFERTTPVTAHQNAAPTADPQKTVQHKEHTSLALKKKVQDVAKLQHLRRQRDEEPAGAEREAVQRSINRIEALGEHNLEEIENKQ